MKTLQALSKLGSVFKAYYFGDCRPFHLNWIITSRCNCRCKFCEFGVNSIYHPNDELSTEECRRLADQLKEAGVKIIVFSGGEVFTRPDFFEILKYVKSLGLTAGVVTNGLLLSTFNEEKINCLKNNLKTLVISLDSPVAEEHDYYRGITGLFNNISRGVKKLQDAGFDRITFQSIIMEPNYRRIPELIEFAHQMKIKKVMFQPINKVTNFPQYDTLEYKDRFVIKDIEAVISFIDQGIKTAKTLRIDTDLIFNRDLLVSYLRNLNQHKGGYFHESVISNYFCFMPFIAGVIFHNADFSPCLMLKPVANLKNVSFKEARKQLTTIKKALKQREFPAECQYCFDQANTNMRFSILCNPIKNITRVRGLISDMYSIFKRFG